MLKENVPTLSSLGTPPFQQVKDLPVLTREDSRQSPFTPAPSYIPESKPRSGSASNNIIPPVYVSTTSNSNTNVSINASDHYQLLPSRSEDQPLYPSLDLNVPKLKPANIVGPKAWGNLPSIGGKAQMTLLYFNNDVLGLDIGMMGESPGRISTLHSNYNRTIFYSL